jgi:hypothetical protein
MTTSIDCLVNPLFLICQQVAPCACLLALILIAVWAVNDLLLV